MKDYEEYFVEWMYPFGDEETPATAVDDRVREFHNYIEKMMEKAFVVGYKQGYSDGIYRAFIDE